MNTLLLTFALAAGGSPDGADLVLAGGRVWTGTEFVRRDLFVRAGTISDAEPPSDAPRLDVEGGYLVPPLVEAHTHRFATTWDAPEAREMFLRDGVLYVANLCNPASSRTDCAPWASGPDGLEVLFTGGGITASGGHPIRLYEELHSGVYGRPAETFWEENDGSTFHVVDDADDLAAKWSQVLAPEPDLVKTLLSHSEEFELRRDDPRYYGHKGLDPALLPGVVELARAEGLRVVTHVDTAADFRNAVRAGVDLIAHTPGYLARGDGDRETWALTVDDARDAKERGVIHVTTASVARGPAALDVIRHNLLLLKEVGVPIAIGSDQWTDGARLEREALVELGVFEPDELLRAWCEDSARALFPTRAVGRLEAGFEGNVTVLAADPLVDPAHLGRVRAVVKLGRVLHRSEAE